MKSTGAVILSVVDRSPADDAGFGKGCILTHVDHEPIRDIIDWQWHSASDRITVSYIDTDGDRGEAVLERETGEPWGFQFEGPVFDGVKSCCNACTFCFINQMPAAVRDTLVFKDDDYRLSFLEGNFVTLTNISAEDEKRIIGQKIAPLRVSLHAITPEIRKRLMGKNEARGIEVLERLSAAGTTFHAQIVLLPHENDGEELRKTLKWAFDRPSILNVGIVPLGFTKHQNTFDTSFDDPRDALKVLCDIAPMQQKAMREKGHPWVYAADEFYCNAYPDTLLEELPPKEHYGEFDLFDDGIGNVRTTVDSWNESAGPIETLSGILGSDKKVLLVVGYAQRAFIAPLIENSSLRGRLVPFFVANEYYGGNVDVTGLLCGGDIVRSLNEAVSEGMRFDRAVVPEVIFNTDGVTLDDLSLEDMQKTSRAPLDVVSCNPSQYLNEIIDLMI